MSKRTDIHCPSNIKPENYEFVAYNNIKIEGFGDCAFILAERETFMAHMAATGAKFSDHDHGGNCDICGAHCIYSAIFYHPETNVYIRTGLDCAEKMFSLDSDLFRAQCRNAMKNQAGKRKAEAFLEIECVPFAYDIYAGKITGIEGREVSTICDMVGKLVKYGDLSQKAIDYLKILVGKIVRKPEIEAQRAAEYAVAKDLPVTEDRIEVRGTVISKKTENGLYGTELKILVKSEDGWKIYGNCPSTGRGIVEVGNTVVFNCRVKASAKDPKFGFFSRPTQFEIISEESK